MIIYDVVDHYRLDELPDRTFFLRYKNIDEYQKILKKYGLPQIG